MKKVVRKNPHAVALGRLGGLVRSAAKQLANQENGRKGGWPKAGERRSPVDAMRGFPVLVAARHQGRNRPDSGAIRLLRHRTG